MIRKSGKIERPYLADNKGPTNLHPNGGTLISAVHVIILPRRNLNGDKEEF
jgi:hypothetical protein